MVIASLSPDGLTPLWKKMQLESAWDQGKLPPWVRRSYEAFIDTIHRENFPCFFASLAEQKEMVRYAIAPSVTTTESFEHILEAVYTYLEEEGNLTVGSSEEHLILLTLVIFFPLEEVEEAEYSLEYYAEQAYTFLNELHLRDRFPWPSEIPIEPQDPEWRYCLGGRSLFVNVSTPTNLQRCSRNLGPGLVAIINPDDVFEKVWKRWGEEPRHNIYKRMEKYDPIPPSPLLSHQKPKRERDLRSAKLTVLSDRNDGECVFPFHYHPTPSKQSKKCR